MDFSLLHQGESMVHPNLSTSLTASVCKVEQYDEKENLNA